MRKHIPNFITLLNLFFGCCALVAVLYGQFLTAFWLLLAGALADFLDGMVARLLKVHSELGKQLDSLADMVSFGAVPGAIFYMLLQYGTSTGEAQTFSILCSTGFILTLFACLRLAKFNIDERQSDSFIGLPTPACALFVVGLMLIYEFNSFGLRPFLLQPIFLWIAIAVLSAAMVAEIPMFSLKFKHLKWKGNEIKFIFAALSLLLLLLLREAAFSLIIIIYLGLALVQKKERSS